MKRLILLALAVCTVGSAMAAPGDQKPVTRFESASQFDRLDHVVKAHDADVAHRKDLEPLRSNAQSLQSDVQAEIQRVDRLEQRIHHMMPQSRATPP